MVSGRSKQDMGSQVNTFLYTIRQGPGDVLLSLNLSDVESKDYQKATQAFKRSFPDGMRSTGEHN